MSNASEYICTYDSPLGLITLASDGQALIGLWFVGQKYDQAGLGHTKFDPELPLFQETRTWLDTYFAGRDPGPIPPVAPRGTAFRQQVWTLLVEIPYGTTITYGALAQRVAEVTGSRVSARAVGGAVGHNPVSIVLPCHRVLGASGSLTGYAGGLDKKAALLALERSGVLECGGTFEHSGTRNLPQQWHPQLVPTKAQLKPGKTKKFHSS